MKKEFQRTIKEYNKFKELIARKPAVKTFDVQKTLNICLTQRNHL